MHAFSKLAREYPSLRDHLAGLCRLGADRRYWLDNADLFVDYVGGSDPPSFIEDSMWDLADYMKKAAKGIPVRINYPEWKDWEMEIDADTPFKIFAKGEAPYVLTGSDPDITRFFGTLGGMIPGADLDLDNGDIYVDRFGSDKTNLTLALRGKTIEAVVHRTVAFTQDEFYEWAQEDEGVRERERGGLWD